RREPHGLLDLSSSLLRARGCLRAFSRSATAASTSALNSCHLSELLFFSCSSLSAAICFFCWSPASALVHSDLALSPVRSDFALRSDSCLARSVNLSERLFCNRSFCWVI